MMNRNKAKLETSISSLISKVLYYLF